MINNLHAQHELWDRKKIIKKLEHLKIPVARSKTVLRGKDKERDKMGESITQEEVEMQAEKTVNKG